jgi:hypothetical protein
LLVVLCPQAGIRHASAIEHTQQDGVEAQQKITAYEVRASVLILGDMGAVGSMKIEESVKRQGNSLERVLYMHGNTDPKQVEKGRDVGGEFRITKRLPLRPDGSIDQAAVAAGQGVENHYTGQLKKEGEITGEEVVFFPDHIISTREDGKETRIQGKFGSPLSALEYLIENDIKTGDVFDSKESVGVSAFKVTVSTYDGKNYTRYGRPVSIKKKGIRVWFCKDGAFKNTIVRMNIKYKWYLTLKIYMKPSV